MKKKLWILIAVVALLLILFLPLPSEKYDDGGSRSYTALTYKIVDWHKMTTGGIYDDVSVYFLPNNFKSIDELWELEMSNMEYSLDVKITEVNNGVVVAEVIDGKGIQTGSRVSFDTKKLKFINLAEHDLVRVTYIGFAKETYPAQIDVVEWELLDAACNCEDVHTDCPEWLDKDNAVKFEDSDLYADYQSVDEPYFVIASVYSDCVFARVYFGEEGYIVKLNGNQLNEWCVGDHVVCTFINAYYNEEMKRIEADLITIKTADLFVCAKPVIYLYPEEETEVTVNLTLDGKLTCTYPAYNNGWTVTASPDGTLTDKNGQTYNYLYWEGETDAQYDLSKGFCVKGEDTAEFLEKALSDLGLNRREANEFIVYWLPLMEQNPYNIISFQTDAYTDAAELKINPASDTLIRVFMAWQASDNFVDLPAQELTAPERVGFTVIEWGGAEITK